MRGAAEVQVAPSTFALSAPSAPCTAPHLSHLSHLVRTSCYFFCKTTLPIAIARTSRAPCCRSTLAHASSVAPVVVRSSTSTHRAPGDAPHPAGAMPRRPPGDGKRGTDIFVPCVSIELELWRRRATATDRRPDRQAGPLKAFGEIGRLIEAAAPLRQGWSGTGISASAPSKMSSFDERSSAPSGAASERRRRTSAHAADPAARLRMVRAIGATLTKPLTGRHSCGASARATGAPQRAHHGGV